MAKNPVIEANPPIQLDEFVTIGEAALLLNLHPAALRARVYRGRIASIRAAAILIPRSEIDRIRRTYIPSDES